MAEELGHDEQMLRTFTAVFAGQVALGPVEIDVTALRRGRTMSQLSATVCNPGAEGGAHRAGGLRRRAHAASSSPTSRCPTCPGTRRCRRSATARRRTAPEEFLRDPLPFWSTRSRASPRSATRRGRTTSRPLPSGRPGSGSTTPRCCPTGASIRSRTSCSADMMPGAVAEKLGPVPDRGLVRAERRPHRPPVQAGARPAGSSATTRPAGRATATPRWRWRCGTRPTGPLVAYATQVMFFTFPEGWS